MPLTPFQKQILAILKDLRSEESHFAGGIVLNAKDDSPRFSRDFDIFHASAEAVAQASLVDVEALEKAGYQVDRIDEAHQWSVVDSASFRQALVRSGEDSLAIDWAADSVFRFFPIVQKEPLGWQLHPFDIAINKALTLATRTETRDYIDMLELCRIYPLAAICWAAPGKDPGYSPLSLLKMMRRFARVDPATMQEIQARKLDPVSMKDEWIQASDQAEASITNLANNQPDTPVGVAFIDASGNPGWIEDHPNLIRHPPCIKGCWPTVYKGSQ